MTFNKRLKLKLDLISSSIEDHFKNLLNDFRKKKVLKVIVGGQLDYVRFEVGFYCYYMT